MTETPLSDQTPREIDTRIADLYDQTGGEESRRESLLSTLRGMKKYRYGGVDGKDYARRIFEHTRKLSELRAELLPLNQEYQRRPWSRFFLVTNGNGHVHSSMSCSTCYPTTMYAWLPELSGKTEGDAVEEWGERMCTVCFPSAPTDPRYNRPARVDREAAEKRAAEKAEREAKKAAKGITNPDGSPLRIKDSWDRSHDKPGRVCKSWRTAQNKVVEMLAEATPCHWYYSAEKVRIAREEAPEIIAALAHKHGKDYDTMKSELEAKAAKKAKKESM